VLVPGFMSAGTVATMMGGERRHEARPQPRHPRPQQKPQHASPQSQRPAPKLSDPIFSKPYEPGQAAAAPKAPEPVTHAKRRERPVAALLGGLKR